MIRASVLPLDPGLTNGEVGDLLEVFDLASRHAEGMALSADQWADLRLQRQQAGRPLHWWEVAFHA